MRFDTLLISIETMDTAKVLFDLKLVQHSKKIPGNFIAEIHGITL